MFAPGPFHERRPGLVGPVRVDPAGLVGPTRSRSRGPSWRRTSHGLFVPAQVDVSVDQRIVEAAAVLREDEAVTGWAALRWGGNPWFDGTVAGRSSRDVPLLVRRDRAAPPGAVVSQEFLHPDEIVDVDGLSITVPLRSVVHEMRSAPTLTDAVVVLDMACYSDLVSIAEVSAYVAALGPVTGIRRVREALVLADENSWSPKETAMRGVWTRRVGLPRPRCNAPVFTRDGRHVGTPDLIDEGLGLVGQYHGADHISLAGAAADVRQDAGYRDLGLETVTMLATDWAHLDDFTRRASAAARRAAAVPFARAWTLDQPEWWKPSHTVALRRAMSPRERQRYLRYRRAVS